MMHVCDRCNKKFSRKILLENHKKKKKKCEIILDTNITELKSLMGKIEEILKDKAIQDKEIAEFKNNQQNEINKLTELINSKDVKIKELEKEIIKLKSNLVPSPPQHQVQIANVINNYNITNITVNFSDSKTFDLSNDKKLRAVNKGYRSVLELTLLTHFNPISEKYRNVYIRHISNRDRCAVYENGHWISRDTQETAEEIYYRGHYYLEEIFEEGQIKPSNNFFENYLKKYNSTNEQDKKEIEAHIKLMKKKIITNMLNIGEIGAIKNKV